MANLVNNNIAGLAKPEVGKMPDAKPAAERVRVDEHAGGHALNNVTENFKRNPNFAKGENIGDELPDDFNENQEQLRTPKAPRNNQGSNASEQGLLHGRGHHKGGNQGEVQIIPRPGIPPVDIDAPVNNPLPKPGRGSENAAQQGLLNGRGHHKGGNQGEVPIIPRPGIPPTDVETPVNNPLPKPGRGIENAAPQGLLNGRGLQKNGEHQNPHQNTHQNNQGNNIQYNQPKPYILLNQPDNDLNEHEERKNRNENRENNFTRQVVREVLRENNIYLNNGAINKLLNKPTANQSPTQLNILVQTIKNQIVTVGLENLNGKTAHQLAVTISNQLHEQIQTIRNNIIQHPEFGVKNFEHLNIKEKMLTGIDLMPKHFPKDFPNHLENHHPKEVLTGMLLARGLIMGDENLANLRNFVASQPAILPRDVNLTAMRDVGQLVRVLIADSAIAKSSANLDLAVQKFIRILLANNELGVLLASISLASQTRNSSGLVSRSLALAQIYELINRLVLAGEKAMKQAATVNTAKNLTQESDFGKFLTVSVSDENEDNLSQFSKRQTNGAETVLRQFLEFNPSFVMDKSVSAFDNSENARQAQQDFVSIYQDDIDRWLRSGNHRLVKEIDLGKPIGIVVERGNSEVFTANTVRMVLVRDSSIQGWHFLKSVLVK